MESWTAWLYQFCLWIHMALRWPVQMEQIDLGCEIARPRRGLKQSWTSGTSQSIQLLHPLFSPLALLWGLPCWDRSRSSIIVVYCCFSSHVPIQLVAWNCLSRIVLVATCAIEPTTFSWSAFVWHVKVSQVGNEWLQTFAKSNQDSYVLLFVFLSFSFVFFLSLSLSLSWKFLLFPWAAWKTRTCW